MTDTRAPSALERAARAAWETRRGITPATRTSLAEKMWTLEGPHEVPAMRAALEALREPTEAMLDAADEPFHANVATFVELSKQRGTALGYASSPFAKALWQAQIDALLTEGQKEPGQ